ncbi:MAG: hypothetical protein IRY99_13900 [Isosphaeraceae bacterium]|nr:hypothetical protein [Isosphaeraceae bacterium]
MIFRRLLCWMLGLSLIAGCWGGRPEGDLPPPRVATPEERDQAAAEVEAGRPKGLSPRPDVPPPGAPRD